MLYDSDGELAPHSNCNGINVYVCIDTRRAMEIGNFLSKAIIYAGLIAR